MKITRNQLRKLILNEIRIKPPVPYASEEQYAKIMDLARSEDNSQKNQADSLADALGYDPVKTGDIYDEEEGKYRDHQGQRKSFSDELHNYDNLLAFYEEIRYLYERLYNSKIPSFVDVPQSDLENKFNTNYTDDDLNRILEILHDKHDRIWELEFHGIGYKDGHGGYSFVYDNQM